MSSDTGADITGGLAAPGGICDHYKNTAAALSIIAFINPVAWVCGPEMAREACRGSPAGGWRRRSGGGGKGHGELRPPPCMLDCKVYH